MVNGQIIWFPACITSIRKTDEGKNALVATEMTYEAMTDNKDHFSDVEHVSVLFWSHKSPLIARKSHIFNCNSILLWRFAEDASSSTVHEDNFPYLQKNLWLMLWALSPPIERIPEVRSMTDCIDLEEDKHQTTSMSSIYSDNHSNRYLRCRRRPPLPYMCRWTTNSLDRCLHWNRSFRSRWLRLSSGHSKNACVFMCHTFLVGATTLPIGDEHTLVLQGIYTYCSGRYTQCGKQSYAISSYTDGILRLPRTLFGCPFAHQNSYHINQGSCLVRHLSPAPIIIRVTFSNPLCHLTSDLRPNCDWNTLLNRAISSSLRHGLSLLSWLFARRLSSLSCLILRRLSELYRVQSVLRSISLEFRTTSSIFEFGWSSWKFLSWYWTSGCRPCKNGWMRYHGGRLFRSVTFLWI